MYPKRAKRFNIQGVVLVSFRILKNGDVTSIKVLKASKSILKKGAIKTIKELVLKKIPTELKQNNMDITLPIQFKLS